MKKTILHDFAHLGQSLWVDNISRAMITSGQLKLLIDLGLRGQTSNPTIFKQSISGSSDYDGHITQLAQSGQSTFAIYDALTIKDVQEAADLFRGVYEATNGIDGYVSLEINPKLAHEVEGQLNEGLRLWKALARPNVMIKVPATKNGLLVVEHLIAQGVNVNVTLIFSAEQYAQVAWAYLKGLTTLVKQGGDVSRVHSVASVFVSRVDTAVDKWLDQAMAGTIDMKRRPMLAALRGRAAVSNAEVIFHKYNNIFGGDDFKGLATQGAHVQRVLWASTGTKDSRYSDIKYITELIACPSVNTVPDKTLEAVLDHGQAKLALPGQVAMAQRTLEELRLLGVDVGIVCNALLAEGLTSFEKSFEDLMSSIEEKSKHLTVK